jgi:fumarate hydratase class II
MSTGFDRRSAGSVIGYDRATAIAHLANDEGTSLRDAALKSGVTGPEFDKVVVPKQMVGNPRRDLGLPAGVQ